MPLSYNIWRFFFSSFLPSSRNQHENSKKTVSWVRKNSSVSYVLCPALIYTDFSKGCVTRNAESTDLFPVMMEQASIKQKKVSCTSSSCKADCDFCAGKVAWQVICKLPETQILAVFVYIFLQDLWLVPRHVGRFPVWVLHDKEHAGLLTLLSLQFTAVFNWSGI